MSELFIPLRNQEKQIIRKEITDGKPYFIYVGSIHPRKNVITLLKAFENIKSRTSISYKLVLVGRMAWKTSKEKAFLKSMNFKNDVILCGNIEDVYLSKFLASVQASIYPSYFEGFGLPVLESFACGVPVITTKNSAMEEIAEDAAFLFNALNIFELENAMLKLANGCDDVSQKIEKGLAIAKKHSWDTTADKIWISLLKTIA